MEEAEIEDKSEQHSIKITEEDLLKT